MTSQLGAEMLDRKNTWGPIVYKGPEATFGSDFSSQIFYEAYQDFVKEGNYYPTPEQMFEKIYNKTLSRSPTHL